MAISTLPFLFNVVWSAFRGEIAGDNPWRALTPEWLTSSPPPVENWKGRAPWCTSPTPTAFPRIRSTSGPPAAGALERRSLLSRISAPGASRPFPCAPASRSDDQPLPRRQQQRLPAADTGHGEEHADHRLFGLLLFLVADGMTFAGFFAAYLTFRAVNPLPPGSNYELELLLPASTRCCWW